MWDKKMGVKIVLISAAITTGIQGLILLLFSGLALAQYLCVINFLRDYTVLKYIKILYFFNPSCNRVINIGSTIDGIPDQAFILISKEPLPTTRLFYINCTNLAISLLSIITSAFLMVSTARGTMTMLARWMWTTITICACVVDTVATISLFNDTFYITTLDNTMMYLNARSYGIGNADIDFSWGAWLMIILYSRVGILFFLNIILLIVVFIWGHLPIVNKEDKVTEMTIPSFDDDLDMEEDLFPMAQLSFQSNERELQPFPETFNNPVSSSSRKPAWMDMNLSKKVHFPENLLSVSQKLDNIMADVEHNLGEAKVHVAEEPTKPNISQSSNLQASKLQSYLDSNKDQTIPESIKERRGTASELQIQRPWAYFPTPSFGIRGGLPSDEDLPPVPLPDYNAKLNKTSVHRAPLDTFKKQEKCSIPKVWNKADVFFY